jgi:hypothetical protein
MKGHRFVDEPVREDVQAPAVTPAKRSAPDTRELAPEELAQVKEQSRAGIVRPHRYPWLPPVLDLADLPCKCSAEAACALHRQELGGPRPYARA